MVEFKASISNPKSGRAYLRDVKGHHANSLIGKKIGDEVDGIFLGLPGYKLIITGGTDKDGFPMRKDIPGAKRARILVSESTGFHPRDKGTRKRVTVRGNTVSPEIVQLNLRIKTVGPKSIEDLFEIKREEKGK